jgi:hypothetical protein
MMKSGAGSEADRRVRPMAAVVLSTFLLLLGGCASDFAIEDAVPHQKADGTYGRARDSGQYPNLNVKPEAATSQLTDTEVATKTRELDTAKARLEARPADTSGMGADAARMRQAGKTQSDDLKDIEGQ